MDVHNPDPAEAWSRAKALTQQGRFEEAALLALDLLRGDERSAPVWRLLAYCREQQGDLTSALEGYKAALQLDPDGADPVGDMARIAAKMGDGALAESLYRAALERDPASDISIQGLASALRDQGRIDEAVEALRAAIIARPEAAALWNQLAAILAEQGRMAQALPFAEEALRLSPGWAAALHNRANIKVALGQAEAALADCEQAIAGALTPADRCRMALSRATMLLGAGDLDRGWAAYGVRFDPDYAAALQFDIAGPMATPDAELHGARLLLVGEQGLGDEILFAGLVPDLLRALGPQGQLTLAVAPRLQSLMQRSFPDVRVTYHHTVEDGGRVRRSVPQVDPSDIDGWAPMGLPLARLRPALSAFPSAPGYLVPAPERVAVWRERLDTLGPGPKIGFTWKSLKTLPSRSRFFPQLEDWRALFELSGGPALVLLQYGAAGDELDRIERMTGRPVWVPPGLDLKDDLDDVAALCAALDIVVGPANCTTNIAGALGVPLGLIGTAEAWPKLGTSGWPWYPQAKVFSPEEPGAWAPAIAAMAGWIAGS